MIEKVILSIAEYFRVFQIICSIFIALAVSFTIERLFCGTPTVVLEASALWMQLAPELYAVFLSGIW